MTPSPTATERAVALLRAAGLAAVLALGAGPAMSRAATLRNTAHDLSSSSTVASGIRAQTDNEICKFCHTPHKALASDLVWNHVQTAQSTWNWGGATTTGSGTPLPTANLRSASRLCLGCHDGTVAVGSLANAGGGVAGTVTMRTGIPGIDATGKLTTKVVGVSGNLSGNHPVGIPYAGQSGYIGVTSGIPAAQVDSAKGHYWRVVTAGCDTPSGVCTEATGNGTIGARMNLVPNVPGTTTNLGIECVTCHEPHNKYGNGAFLRVDGTVTDSLCRSCHNK